MDENNSIVKMKKLNVACGEDYKLGWVNADINKETKADVYFDLEKKFPFKDNTFDYVYTCHTLEHVKDLIGCMSELKRICKKGAVIEIRVPHALSISSYQDPTHVRFFTYNTFEYFNKNAKQHYKSSFPKFEIIEKRLSYTALNRGINLIMNPIININPVIYERAFGWIFPCGELRVKLRVIK